MLMKSVEHNAAHQELNIKFIFHSFKQTDDGIKINATLIITILGRSVHKYRLPNCVSVLSIYLLSALWTKERTVVIQFVTFILKMSKNTRVKQR